MIAAAATVAQLVMPALTADGVGDGPFAPLVLDLIGKAHPEQCSGPGFDAQPICVKNPSLPGEIIAPVLPARLYRVQEDDHAARGRWERQSRGSRRTAGNRVLDDREGRHAY